MKPNDRTPHILLAEDDDDLRPLLAAALRARGYRVTAVDDGVGLLAGIQFSSWNASDDRIEAIVADINMPGLSAIEVMDAVRCSGFATPVVLITGEDIARLGDVGNVAGIYQKPVDIDALAAMLRSLIAAPTAA